MTEPGARLRGRRALVTGAGTRLGAAIARELGARGMRVAVHHRASAEGARETCAAVRAAGGEAVALVADLSDRDQARDLARRAIEALGGLDLLVASAGSFERIGVEEVDDAAFDRSMALNVASPFALARAALPALRAARGSIVFLTCSSATVPFRHYLPYVVSKGAVRQLARTLALELAPEVRVNAVAPGAVLPPEGLASEALERIAARAPLGRLGDAREVARAVAWLAESEFVTGHEVVIDGGRTVAALE